MPKTVRHGGPKDWTPGSREEKVLFRKWPDGEIVALFPEIPADVNGWSCTAYSRVGQHGGANASRVVGDTKAAKPDEYAELLGELGRIGYTRLKIMKRMTPSMLLERQKRAKAER